MAQDAIHQHLVRDIPLEFISATMDTSAQTTMRFMASDPESADRYRTVGFDMFWRAIAKK
jgi:hypothetical protein